MNMTDAELDRDWQPNGRRPQSTIARSFSAELADIFRLENSLTDLNAKVDQRKQTVDKNTEELASLEARIREMEERLTGKGMHLRPVLPQTQHGGASSLAAPSLSKDNSNKSRPGTARANQRAPGSGNMPPTPGASEDGNGE